MKVKVDIAFQRTLDYKIDVGKKIMNSFTEEIGDIAVVEKKPVLEGNTMSCVLAPKKKQLLTGGTTYAKDEITQRTCKTC